MINFLNGAVKIALLALVMPFLLQGCKVEEGKIKPTLTSKNLRVPKVSLSLPTSLTGNRASGSSQTLENDVLDAVIPPVTALDGEIKCDFVGTIDDEKFKNGYRMTQFLSKLAASYICFADKLIEIPTKNEFELDGTVYKISYKDGDKTVTGTSLKKDGADQYTLKFFYNNQTAKPGWYISWKKTGDDVKGKIVMLNSDIGKTLDAIDDAAKLRVDFTQADGKTTVDIYTVLSDANKTEAFRMNLVKNTDANDAVVDKIKVKGILKVRKQPLVSAAIASDNAIKDIFPVFKVNAIAEGTGKGAASALMDKLVLGAADIGYYQLAFRDKYFFTSTGSSEWVNKTVTAAERKLNGTSNPTECDVANSTACKTYWNNWFTSSPDLDYKNSGSDPGDERSNIINPLTAADYMTSVYPDGKSNWDGVFDMTFTP